MRAIGANSLDALERFVHLRGSRQDASVRILNLFAVVAVLKVTLAADVGDAEVGDLHPTSAARDAEDVLASKIPRRRGVL